MQKEITLQLSPEQAADEGLIISVACKAANINKQLCSGYYITRKSIDARSKNIIVNLTLRLYVGEPKPATPIEQIIYEQLPANAQSVVIVGAGPAGLFAALRCIELGIKPVVIERGKDVRSRRHDLAKLNKEGELNEESNYCFGEGGAGTYSDGKLYTRSNKRGNIKKILSVFYQFGADENILYVNHPHIGTNKLPHIITAIREQIINCGGEVLFETKLLDIDIRGNTIKSVETNKGKIETNHLVLATGHSARDIYDLLQSKNVYIESKPYALGVRVEHPQSVINASMYKNEDCRLYLPPASYSLVQQIDGKGVFSFCMCPGGIIAPASTEKNGLVVNGWSPSKRNNPYANSGIVVSVDDKDFLPYTKHKELRGLYYQKAVEEKCYIAGGGKFVAPAQRLVDFVNKKISTDLPLNSYLPGLQSVNIHDVLPEQVASALSQAFVEFGKKIKNYYSNEAIIVATESRTSAPVKIPRDNETFMHPQVQGLFPCGEGAGYSGGIVSAAMDGENVAFAVYQNIKAHLYK